MIFFLLRNSQFIWKSLPAKNDLTLTIAMYLTLSKSIFFFLNVISYSCYTNSCDFYYYSPCIFPSGISDVYRVVFAFSNSPLCCFPERSVNFIELSRSVASCSWTQLCSEQRTYTDVQSSYRYICICPQTDRKLLIPLP